MAKATKKAAEKVLGGPVKTVKEPKKVAALEYERPAAKTKAPKAEKFKIPKKLAEVADLYYQTRDERLAKEKEAAAIQEREKLLKDYLIDNLPKSQAGGITGKLARVEISKRPVPALEDPKKFFAYAHRKGNEDLVKETMVQSSVQARWEAGKTVPGVGTFTVIGLSLHKLK